MKSNLYKILKGVFIASVVALGATSESEAPVKPAEDNGNVVSLANNDVKPTKKMILKMSHDNSYLLAGHSSHSSHSSHRSHSSHYSSKVS